MFAKRFWLWYDSYECSVSPCDKHNGKSIKL